MSGPGIKTVSYLLKELTAALREIQRISFEIEDSGDAFANNQRAININSIASRASCYVEDLIHTPPVSSMMKACKDGIDETEALKREIYEAVRFVNKYLEDAALDPKAHNWLIRNGYQDASYQADIFGQEIVKEGDST